MQDLGEKILLSIFFQYLHLSFLEDREKFANNSIVSGWNWKQGGKVELFCILETSYFDSFKKPSLFLNEKKSYTYFLRSIFLVYCIFSLVATIFWPVLYWSCTCKKTRQSSLSSTILMMKEAFYQQLEPLFCNCAFCLGRKNPRLNSRNLSLSMKYHVWSFIKKWIELSTQT